MFGKEGLVMRCPKCGKELQDNWVKCPYCNTDILKMQGDETTDRYQGEKDRKAQVNYMSLIWGKIKKVLKIVIYIFVAILIILGPFTTSGMGTSKDSVIEIVSYYSYVLFLVILPLVLIFNIKGIRDKLPFYKKHRIGSTVIASVLTYFLISVILIGTVLFSESLYSQEYKAERKTQQEAEEKVMAEKEVEVEEEEAAEKEAEEEEVAVKEVEEEEAAEEEAEEIKAPETEAAEKEETEKKTSENTSGNQEEVNQQTTDIEEYSTYPYLSKEYLIYSLSQMEINFPLYPQETIVDSFLDSCDNISYQNVNIAGLFSNYYEIVENNTNYVYFGETKNGRPDGLGVIKEKFIIQDINLEENKILLNQYDDDIDLVNGEVYYATIYAGYFSNGQYEGFGMLYKSPYDEEYLGDGIRLEDYFQNTANGDIQKSITMSINPLTFEGYFEKGEYSEGLDIIYAGLYSGYLPEEIEDLEGEEKEKAIELSKVIGIYRYENGEPMEMITTDGREDLS